MQGQEKVHIMLQLVYDRKDYGRQLRPHYGENYGRKAYGEVFVLRYITVRILTAVRLPYGRNSAIITAVRAKFGRKGALRP